MRLKDKVAIVVGAGQSPGEGLGNGRATVLRFAQEGAKVLAVDSNLSSAEQTVAMARQSGGECAACEADVTNEATLAAMVEAARRYLKAYDSVSEARASIGRYLDFYNSRRPHTGLDRRTPDQAYFNQPPFRMAA